MSFETGNYRRLTGHLALPVVNCAYSTAPSPSASGTTKGKNNRQQSDATLNFQSITYSGDEFLQ